MERFPELHTLLHVTDRLRTHRGVPVRDAAEPVFAVLEAVRIDGADADTERLRLLVHGSSVLREIPEDVRRYERRDAGVPVDLGRILQLLINRDGGARLRKDAEPRPGIGI